MATYKIIHPATNKVVNLYSTSASGSIANGARLLLYNWENNNDQKWELESVGDYAIFRIARDRNKVMNRHSTNNNAHVWDYDGSDATQRDSVVNTETINGNMRIKLVHRNLYLTKNTYDNYLSWAAKIESNRQYFKMEDVSGGITPPPSGQGGGNGPYGNYVYPTACKGYRGGYSYGHPAIDILDYDDDHKIYAFADGVVSFTQNSTGHWTPNTEEGNLHLGKMDSMGNCIAINHNNPISNRTGTYARTIYMHMLNKPQLSPGARVVKGQIIGTIGNTGLSSGNHFDDVQ